MCAPWEARSRLRSRRGRRRPDRHMSPRVATRSPPHQPNTRRHSESATSRASQHVSRCPRAHSNSVASRPPARSATTPAANSPGASKPLGPNRRRWRRRDMSGDRATTLAIGRPAVGFTRRRHRDRPARPPGIPVQSLAPTAATVTATTVNRQLSRARLRLEIACRHEARDVHDRTHDNISVSRSCSDFGEACRMHARLGPLLEETNPPTFAPILHERESSIWSRMQT